MKHERGFTFLEMMVVIVIVAVAMTGVALSIGATSQAKLRSSCWTVISAVRYGYSHAVTRGMATRLVMDFDARTFHLEDTPGRLVLNRDDETGEGLHREGISDLDGGVPGKSLLDNQMDSIGSGMGAGTGGAGLGTSSGTTGMGGMGGMGMGGMGMGGMGGMGGQAGAEGGGMTGMMDTLSGGRLSDPFLASAAAGSMGNPMGYRRPKFSQLQGRRGEKRTLEGETKFHVVFTPHSPEPVKEGKAYLYFFPGGVTEHSILQLSDGDERIYSIEVHPLTGRAVIHNEEVAPTEDLEELQEADE